MPTTPPILIDCHPLFSKLETMAADPVIRASVIAGIQAGGTPETRLGEIKNDGLLADYSDPSAAEAFLLGGEWGDSTDLTSISEALCDAFELCGSTGKPLKMSWAAGTTASGIHPLVVNAADDICLVLMTGVLELTNASFLNGKGFDAAFKTNLKTHGTAVENYTDSL